MATQGVNIVKLVHADGKFKDGIQEDLKLDVKRDSPVAVVSIIGVQSSGKSTLLNYMFGTKFEEMDAAKGRRRTTRGIWLAKYSLEQGCILVIDTEGSDGRERQGNETFARQAAVFSMALSHVVIINMMCTDIGREWGGGWPLLTTACEVMLRGFKKRHQVTLLFVLRDKTDTPLHKLKEQIMAGMEKILKKMTGSQAEAKARLSELFKIEVVTTSHYLVESERENFKAEVNKLKKWIISHTSDKRTSKTIPAASFTEYANKIWDEIKRKKYLDLPSYRIFVEKEYCKRIVNDQRNSFGKDESWIQIKKNVRSDSITEGFGKKVSDLIRTYRSRYDEVAEFYDRTASSKYRKLLITELLEIIKPTYLRLVERMRSKTLKDFRKAALNELRERGKLKAIKVQGFITEFKDLLKDACIEQANWTDASTQCDRLKQDIDFFIGDIAEMNTILDKGKKNKISAWNEIAKSISAGAGLAVTVAVSALVHPLGVAVAPAILPLLIKAFGL